MAECPICTASLRDYDEAASTFHVTACLDGLEAQLGPTIQARCESPIYTTCPICDNGVSTEISLQDHVEACLVSQSLNAGASEQCMGIQTSDEDACPSCFLEWSVMGIPPDVRNIHKAECMGQFQALADDISQDLESGGGVDLLDEKDDSLNQKQMLSLFSANGIQNGFGMLRSTIKSKVKSDPSTPNLIPQLSLLLNRSFSSNSIFTRSAVLCSPNVCHLRSQPADFGWGCGYRNAQMIISALRHVNQYRHLFSNRTKSQDRHAKVNGTNDSKRKTSPSTNNNKVNVGEIPAILELQEIAETAWNAGFDSEGAKHFKGRLVGSRRWIGTSEVYVILTFLGVR